MWCGGVFLLLIHTTRCERRSRGGMSALIETRGSQGGLFTMNGMSEFERDAVEAQAGSVFDGCRVV